MNPTFPDFPLHFRSARAQSWHPKEIGQYKRASVALNYVKGWNLAVDVGAYCGAWSYAFAQRFKRVYMFEPFPEHHDLARQNLAPYQNVIRYQVALLDKKGDGSMMHGGSKYNYLKFGEGPVMVEPLDRYELPACDLLKIDAEGADALVLQGAERTIATYSPVIIVEEKDSEVRLFGLNPGAVNTLLTGWGYRRVWQHAPDGIYVKG